MDVDLVQFSILIWSKNMRAGLQGISFLEIEDEFIGICLGWDFCAEHEWRVVNIKRMFAIPDNPDKLLGFDARKIQKCPDTLKLIFDGTKTYLINIGYIDKINHEICEELITNEQSYNKDAELLCAWDNSSFGIRTIGHKGRKMLETLFHAFKERDIVIYLGEKQSPFSNSGLTLCIYSRLPNDAKESAIAQDKDQIRLTKVAKETGIEEKILSANNKIKVWDQPYGYYALCPAWVNEGERKRTKYKVKFFLNPRKQNKNNCGWFTVEELEQWLEGKGPVLK